MLRISSLLPTVLLLPLFTTTAFGDGPKDNIPGKVRPIPRIGIEVPAPQQAELERQLAALKEQLAQLRRQKDRRIQDLLPDVEIFYRAVRTNLDHREFFAPADVKKAFTLLATGRQRAGQLLAGKAPWTTQTGLVVRGYRSKIDGTVQPYGLVVPPSYSHRSARGYRLDIWFHGRGETLSETRFIDQRRKQVGRYAPANTLVLHPYGRYSNAFKFAGEVDVLEALDHVRRHYRVDADRIAVRGFSMGGAACWQFAVHYADRWFAANPGAGFAETPEFLKFFQKETLHPTWYEQRLWTLYDCPGYAINLYHCPTVAYSGELDIQKQAADVMEAALADVGIRLLHIIGPKTKHAIHPDSAREIERRMAALARTGRRRFPRHIRFATYTLKYNRMHWVTLNALGEHWKQATVTADVSPNNHIALKTENVTDLTIDMSPGSPLLDIRRPVKLDVNGSRLKAPRPLSDRSFTVRLIQQGDRWKIATAADVPAELAKRHNLQGPVDDAFMDSFLFVSPTKKAAYPAVERWTRSELKRAVVHWRQQFRGDARVKAADAVTAADIAHSNLILFGDARSNPLIARILPQLPLRWDGKFITVGQRRFDAAHHALILIYPNPLNPQRYVVFNSGFTYREYAYLNNARQVPMLPDWAVIDLRTPPGTQYPGKVAAADFFDEQWQLKSSPASARGK